MDRTIESQRPVVLPVEDNENVNAANRQLLEREGYAAPTLIEASLARDDPALVLLGIHLPDGNGLSLLPELGNVPVLVLSGKKAAKAVAIGNGARAFVRKPCRASPPLPHKRA